MLGLVIIGTGGAALAAVTTPPPPPAVGSSTLAATSATKTPTAVASKPTATPISVPVSAPTATNPPPTDVPPTATPMPAVGQQTTVRGTVATINANASPKNFTVNTSTGLVTIDVSGSTQFSGRATTFSMLRTGWQVTVQGNVQKDGSVLAVSVDASTDN